MLISPEDETEENYKVIDTKVVDDELAELVIACRKCGNAINLLAFNRVRTKF